MGKAMAINGISPTRVHGTKTHTPRGRTRIRTKMSMDVEKRVTGTQEHLDSTPLARLEVDMSITPPKRGVGIRGRLPR